jgi:hypothetical protein
MHKSGLFEKELKRLINSISMENGSNTPDFILARYLTACLENFNNAVHARDKWYGEIKEPGNAHPMELRDW